jgi:FkbM family methyltransferase
MISYAQNLEDVIFQRVFDRDDGFYIDVGANDPVIDSATYALYRRGWRGISVEPQAALHARALEIRPGDKNIQALASDTEEIVTFYEVEPWHYLSTLDPTIADQHAAEGGTVREIRRPALTLNTILAEHLGSRVIDLLAVDVEGAEAKVLAGLDLTRYRPTLIMIEAMAPERQVDVSQPSEAILRGAHYDPVYEDGLNRFFLAAEHSVLKPCFRYPPNVFDGFRRAEEIALEAALEAARSRIAELERLLAERVRGPKRDQGLPGPQGSIRPAVPQEPKGDAGPMGPLSQSKGEP